MSNKDIIIIFGVFGTLVLANLVYSFATFSYEEGPGNSEEANEEKLFFLVYVPIMALAGFMLFPLMYEDVSTSFKWAILTISGINIMLFLRFFIPLVLSIILITILFFK